MAEQKLIIDKSILNLSPKELRPHFIGELYRLHNINFVIYIDSISSCSISKVLLSNHFIDTDDLTLHETDSSKKAIYDGEYFVLQQKNTSDQKFVTFKELTDQLIYPIRVHKLIRKTKETNIEVELNLDGTGKSEIDTGIGFFDHMIDQIAKHSRIDLKLLCRGDLNVDEHHSIEDTALALGEAILSALGDKKGIERYSFIMPMDESVCTMSLDLSGRPFLVYEADFKREYVGDFPTDMTKHFFYSVAIALKATLHISVSGENDHHKIESMFKSFALILRNAIKRDEKALNIIPSSKGVL